MKKFYLILVIVFLYCLSYLWFRSGHQEVWQGGERQRTYVIFPNNVVYYFYRPLSLIDDRLTYMNFHIGPHQ